MSSISNTPSSNTSLTSLLNTLQSHLQSQIHQLPTLHAQLGLPPSALQDELSLLQDKLMHTVEVQMDARRKEVDEWMGKCSGVEEDCVKYTKALGGNIKATGSTVGEIRGEQSLPKRYEMVTAYQEKLRQVYHTKLEQFTTLTNRLNALSRTLGTGFYQPDILELAPYTSDTAAPDNAAASHRDTTSHKDAAPHRDLTPERFSKLEKELVRGKAEVAKRLSQLSEIFSQIDWLRTELGIQLDSEDNDDNDVVDAAADSADPFLCASTSTPTRSSLSSIRPSLLAPKSLFSDTPTDFHHIFATYVVANTDADSAAAPPSGSSVPRGLEGVDPTPSLLSWATSELASLSETKRRRESHIQALYDQLETLWRRLGVADADMDAFVDVHRGSTKEAVRGYEEELERMLEVKRERMGEFVCGAREEIWRIWEEMLVGEEERGEFAPFADDEFTEDLLTIHEEEISRLKEEHRLKAPLLASIKKYFQICEEEKELAAAASDQSRLLGRGAGGARDPGRLLREEKMRKRVKKEKPRLEQDLLASIPAWEHETGQPFLVHGQSMLQILIANASAADQENTTSTSTSTSTGAGARKRANSATNRGHLRSNSAGSTTATGAGMHLRAQTPGTGMRAKTPVAGQRAAGAGAGAVTPAVRPSSSMSMSMSSHGPASKRQRVDATPATARAPLRDHGSANTRPGTGVGSAARSASVGRNLGASVGRNGSASGAPPRAQTVSPTKIPGYGKGVGGGGAGAGGAGGERPPMPHLVMPVPRHGAAIGVGAGAGAAAGHRALGHGRVPSAGYARAQVTSGTSTSTSMGRSVSAYALSQSQSHGVNRFPSASMAAAGVKVENAKRESFRPRPSVDAREVFGGGAGIGGGIGGGAGAVKRWAASVGMGGVKEEEEYIGVDGGYAY
ncbi:hypothetical protein HGRIS_014041 [Hohenbuehelia grisea]|uniref:Microtubule associated protein n=1 Tax=Hohenbuehelia grisea TaxID=104357 RepID=A0ABR3JSE5_9AGAR